MSESEVKTEIREFIKANFMVATEFDGDDSFLQQRSAEDQQVYCRKFGVAGLLVRQRIDDCDADHDEQIGHVLRANRVRAVSQDAKDREQAERHSNSQLELLQ